MLFKEKIIVMSEVNMKPINAFCAKTAELLKVKAG
jgi:hypothetical protein